MLSDGCRTAVGAVGAVGRLSDSCRSCRSCPTAVGGARASSQRNHCRSLSAAVGLSMSDCWCCWTAVGAVVSRGAVEYDWDSDESDCIFFLYLLVFEDTEPTA